jgi:hypothetical protein
MIRDDIIRLAQEAGAGEPESLYGRTDYVVMTWFELERFANFVAAAEREACAKVAELVAQEIDDTNGTATYIAKAIRAKGET